MDDANPDIVWCGSTNEYLVCWEDRTSEENSDVYLTSFDWLGSQGDTIPIRIGISDWAEPSIAYAYGADRALIVASVDADNAFSGRILGRVVDVDLFQTTDGFSYILSGLGEAPKRHPAVGGTNLDSLLDAYFCVTWELESGAGLSTVQYRLVRLNGLVFTNVADVGPVAENNITPTISRGLGDTSLADDQWTISWILDEDGDGQGQVWALRVPWNGVQGLSAGKFLVDGLRFNSSPSASSLFDDRLLSNGERPSIIAFQRNEGAIGSIMARVITDGVSFPLNEITGVQVDFDGSLDQRQPVVASDGLGFFLAYTEEKWSNIGSGDRDVYLATASISEQEDGARVALLERRIALGVTDDAEFQLSICAMGDGETNTGSDDGACIWMQETNPAPGFGTLVGYTFDMGTIMGWEDKAVGVQFCDANPNSNGVIDGRTSSWLSLVGDGTANDSDLNALAYDLPLSVACLLVTSLQTGDVNLVGGGMGRLCLGGAIGRFTSQIQLSSASGTAQVDVDPQMLPQPGGLVGAVPGETWYFQLWHRDFVAGVVTSNLTNACAVVFTP